MMGLIKSERSSAMYRCKDRSLNLIDTLFFCCLTALVCSLFFSGSFWVPSLQASSTKFSLILSSLSETTNSIFPSSKCVFIVGNLIVVVLIGESKIFSSETSGRRPANDHVCLHDENIINRSLNFRDPSTGAERGEKRVLGSWGFEGTTNRHISGVEEKMEGQEYADEQMDDECESTLPAEELSKRADDFIARFNMQRKIEDIMLPYCCEWTTMRKRYRKRNCLKDSLGLCN